VNRRMLSISCDLGAFVLTLPVFAADAPAQSVHRYSVGVRWVESYANADETKTFCVYEGPNEAAVRKAAELNKLPVDSITEVPVTLSPK